jgi:hypothetical protein
MVQTTKLTKNTKKGKEEWKQVFGQPAYTFSSSSFSLFVFFVSFVVKSGVPMLLGLI